MFVINPRYITPDRYYIDAQTVSHGGEYTSVVMVVCYQTKYQIWTPEQQYYVSAGQRTDYLKQLFLI